MNKDKKNRPWLITDEFGKSRTIWESRSSASALFVFTKDKEGYWRVLSVKRGSGCPDYQGYWVCPCGYLDYNESLTNAAFRECWEETGTKISQFKIKYYKCNSHPSENLQNITHIFYAIVENGFDYSFSNKNNEKDEVDEVAWIRVDQLDIVKWAFKHNDIINEIFEMRVNLPWWKKIIFNLYEKHLSPESYKEYA